MTVELQNWLRDFVGRIRQETRVPGIAVGVTLDGQRLYACAGMTAFGTPLTEYHRFHLGCGTKLLLAVVTLELAARGTLDLATPVADVLPELRSSPHGAVRIAHLLSHTSGYRGTDLGDPATRELTWPGLVDLLRSSPQHFAPGTVFSYEHSESVLLAEVLERVASRSGLELVNELVFAPLAITPGDFVTEHGGELDAGRHTPFAAGQFELIVGAPRVPPLWALAFSRFAVSVADLTTIAEWLCSPSGTGQRAISGRTLELLRRPAIALPPTIGGPLAELLPIEFGFGLARLRGDFFGSSGLTHGQCVGLRFDPTIGLTVTVGLNATLPYLRDLVLTAVCRHITGRPGPAERPPLELMLAELGGHYRGPGKSVAEVACTHERLIVALGRENSAERLPAELALDETGRCVLRTPIPQLSIGFFRVGPADVGLMIGLHAYKRV